MKTYTRQEVIQRVINHFQLFNLRNPQAVHGGLTSKEVDFIGDLASALPLEDEPVGRVYEDKGYDVTQLFI